ncbi:hypothetical protein [Pararcticibacter amylolyticus]|uniref:Uncharacterized protein n=1 Tax=Pararcticibacter amylolyticus TaxID=2173175 RepID=A0A2U2PGF4_9SPHI|nr:hypothetical protein [Pararcticibacter amylolyticus]PWG80209.1 hypothetical protein DDR33_13530 [Pararcticibacter amylolyticus]
MKIIRKSDEHEMMQRWALGEIEVERKGKSAEIQTLENRLTLLRSDNREEQKTAIEGTLKTHHVSLVKCIPEDAAYFLANLDVSRREFDLLRTLPVPDLAKVTNNTYRLSYGAVLVSQHPDLNPRIVQIMDSFRKGGHVEMAGITLLAKDVAGPYTVIEGNGRLMSLYQLLFFENRKIFYQEEIEVILALSPHDL